MYELHRIFEASKDFKFTANLVAVDSVTFPGTFVPAPLNGSINASSCAGNTLPANEVINAKRWDVDIAGLFGGSALVRDAGWTVNDGGPQNNGIAWFIRGTFFSGVGETIQEDGGLFYPSTDVVIQAVDTTSGNGVYLVSVATGAPGEATSPIVCTVFGKSVPLYYFPPSDGSDVTGTLDITFCDTAGFFTFGGLRDTDTGHFTATSI